MCSFVLLSKKENKNYKPAIKKGVGQSEKLFLKKLQRCWGDANAPCQKQNAFFDLLLQKMSGQPLANGQNQPLKTPHFAPYYKGAQNYTNHITLIICALQTTFCVFVFLCFCV